MGKLTAISARNAKPGRHSDGDGLYLLVKPTGARSWFLRVQKDGRRRDIGLGSLAKTSLAEAREKAAELRRHALNGRDPVAERDRRTFEPKTFREAAEAVHTEHSPTWAKKTADSFLATLREYAFPTLGKLRVEDVDATDIVAALKPIWHAKPAIAVKVRQRIITVLSYSKAAKWRTSEAPILSLAALLTKQPAGGAMAAMPYADVPAFVRQLQARDETPSRLALLFTIATAARSGEVRKAKWEQIDIEARTWSRPAEIMKAGKPHVITLNDAALAILKRAEQHRGIDGLLFPSPSRKILSDMTLSKIMRDAKSPFVPHGFRSSFRDWAAEQMPDIPDPVAEAALAHAVPDKVIGAYKRTNFLELRRQLLDAWGAFLAAPK